jgi:hypothetical protein
MVEESASYPPPFSSISTKNIAPVSNENEEYTALLRETQMHRIQGLETGIIAGIVVFSIVIVILIAMLIFLLVTSNQGVWGKTTNIATQHTSTLALNPSLSGAIKEKDQVPESLGIPNMESTSQPLEINSEHDVQEEIKETPRSLTKRRLFPNTPHPQKKQ